MAIAHEKGAAPASAAPCDCKSFFTPPYRAISSHYQGKSIDFRRIREAARAAAPHLLQALLPGGRRRGSEWQALNPRRADRNPGSFSVNLRTGAWADFATGDRGGDLIGLYAYLANIDAGQAAQAVAALLSISPWQGGAG